MSLDYATNPSSSGGTFVVLSPEILRRYTRDELVLIAADYKRMFGCERVEFCISTDGYVLISCEHPQHPILDAATAYGS